MNKQTLYEKIYSDLVREIQNGNYKIGMQVPTEKELSQKYKVSRITSKKALDKLAEQGIINRIPGKGSFVENTNIQSAYSNNKDDKERILIGVIMDGFGASFGCGVLQGIIQECRTYNMDFILRSSHGSKEIETQAINDLIALGVEGIIIMCVHDENYNATILKHVIEGFPIVSVDRRMKGVPISYVGTDNKKAAKDLTNILLDKKFESICFVSHMRMDTSTISDRKTGFIESHLEHNLTTASSLWITDLKSTLPSCYSEEAVHEDIAKVRNVIQKHNQIQAFFALEYEIARIIYKVLVELELEKERPIVCFDGVGNIVNDILFTHIKQDENVIGARSVALLADKIKGDSKVETVLVPHKILFSNEFTNIGPQ